MENEFVTYEQAVKLKELGFDSPCFRYVYIENNKQTNEVKPRFSDNFNSSKLIVSIPLKQQVFRWFRNYSEHYKVQSTIQEYDINNWMYSIDDGVQSDIAMIGFNTYEEAENECINQLISLIESKN